MIAVLPAVTVLLSLLSVANVAHSQVSAGNWVSASTGTAFLSSPRSGAATVLLPDGHLLITGGDNGSGAIANVDLSDSSGNVSSTGTMTRGRQHHTATLLQDGTVLVAGGVSDGLATNTAEIYNPLTGSWTATTGSMMTARSGHTATLLNDGTVLIAGGVSAGNALNSVEIYNPANGTFSLANGSLSSPREAHAAVLLHDGRVLIIGGWDGNTQTLVPPAIAGAPNVLASTDIYDPSTQTIAAGPMLNTARMNHTATVQVDGQVFVVGGNSGSTDLVSAEVLDPTITPPPATFSMASLSLTTARSNHLAFLLPHNGGTLIVGGTAAGTAIASSELYFPAYLSQTQTATLTPTKPMNSERAYATGGAYSNGAVDSSHDGLLLVAGGVGASGTPLGSGEFFGFPWVKTDALDYPPGTPVNVSGGGFQPGETVTLHFQETPNFDSHADLTAIVQADGTFSNSQFAPDVHDIDISFYLTVTGSASGAQAQTVFSDSVNLKTIALTVENGVCTTAQSSFHTGDSVCASALVTTKNTGAPATLSVLWYNPTGTLDHQSTYAVPASSSSQTFTDKYVTSSSSQIGLWTVKTCSDSGCTGSPQDSQTFTLARAASRLAFTNTPLTTIAGQCSTSLTIQSQDSSGNPSAVTTGENVSLSSNSASGGFYSDSSCNSSITNLSIPNGSSSASFFYKDTHSGTPSVNAVGTGAFVSSVSQSETVAAGTIAAFVFSSFSTPPTAGTPFNVTITAEDAFGNVATSYSGSSDKATISSTGTLSGGTFVTQPFVNGVITLSLTITNTGRFTITATANGNGQAVSGTSSPFTVNAGAATHFALVAPASATAGTPLNFTVTALDAYSNTASGYLGTVRFTSTDTQATLPANYTFTAADNGVHTFSGTLKTAGNQVITSTDTVTPSTTGTSGNIAVTAGPAASISAIAGTPQSTALNTAFAANLAAKVVDAYSNPVSGATVTFAAPGSGASGTFAGGINTATTNSSGVATAAVFTANGTAGQYTVAATTAGIATPTSFLLTNNNPVPTLTSLSPTSGTLTNTLNVVLTGTNFLSGVTSVRMGTDITVNSVTVNSNTQLTISITIPAGASLGAHTISVTNPAPGGGTASLAGAFTVVGTSPQITSAPGATFTAGTGGSFAVTSTANPTAVLSATGTLPVGLTFRDNGNGTATLAGTATVAGSYPITLVAQNGITPNATQTFTLTVTPGSVARITLNPAAQTIAAGGSAAFTAAGYDQYGNLIGNVTGATVFTVANGSCTANSCGSTLAGAQLVTGSDGGFTGTATLNVQAGTITHLALTPSSGAIVAGASQSYVAIGLDAYGNPSGDVTGSTSFSIAPDGACTGASCTASIADANGSVHTVSGTFAGTGAQGLASLTVTSGTFSQLQLLMPGETAAPGTANGKTGSPNIQYVNGPFQAIVNAVDQYWNVVSSASDTIQITSNDGRAVLPSGAALSSGTGVFNVTLQTVSYKPATTTLTATDQTNSALMASTSPALRVIAAYTAAISPADWATGQAGTYTLTVNNSAAPNTNNLGSLQIAIPAGDQGSISKISVTATQPGGAVTNWVPDPSQLPGALRFHAVSASDAVAPGGAITVGFTATSNIVITNVAAQEVWNTVAYSDLAFASALPLASAEPTVSLGAAPQITSVNTTNAFTYGTAGTIFTVTTTGVPTPTLNANGSLPSWATFKDNGDGTATISGTPNAAGPSSFTITAHNGYGNDATQSFALIVNQATLNIAADAKTKVYGVTDPPLTYTVSGFKLNDTAAAVLTGSVTRSPGENVNTSPGYAITQGSLTANSNYAINFTGNYLTITPATLTLSMVGGGGIYMAAPYTASCSVSTGLVGGDKVVLAVTYSSGSAPINVGSYLATCTSGGNPNYNQATAQTPIVIAPAMLTVTANPQSMFFGGATPTFNASYTGFQGADNPDVLMGLTYQTFTDGTLATPVSDYQTLRVGSYPVVPGGATALNYRLQYVNGTLSVNKAVLTGSLTVTPADPATVAYGQPATATVHLDSYSIGGVEVLQSHNDLNSPYTPLPPSLTVWLVPMGGGPTQAIKFGTATAVPTYDNTTNTSGTTRTGWTAMITGIAPPPGHYSAVAYGDDPGDGSLSSINLADAGYFYTDTADISYPNLISNQLDVVPAPLTITANSNSKTYGQTVTFAGTEFTSNGLVSGTTDSVTSVSLASTGAAATAAAGSYAIIPSNAQGSGLSNYTITYTNGTMQVNPAPLVITASSGTMTYGGTVPLVTASFATLLNNDSAASLGVRCTTTATSLSSVGSYPTSCTGAVNANYSISYVAGTMQVNPASLVITANSRSKTYGQPVTFVGTEFTTSGLVSGTTDSVTSVSLTSAGALASATVGAPGPTYAIVPSRAAGTGLSNYSISYLNGTLTVSKATPTITWPAPAAITYGTPLSSTQLDASASYLNAGLSTPLVGSFSYSPAAAMTLNAGQNQQLSVSFTPTDTVDFNSTTGSTTLSVNPYPLLASVTVSSPATPIIASQYSDPAVITVSFTAPGPLPRVSGTTATVSFGTQAFPGLAFACVGTPVVCTASTPAPPDPKAVYLMQAPGSYTVQVAYSGFDTNFAINNPTANLTIVQEDAAVTYTGNTFFSVPSTQTAVNVPVSFTLQDATATGAGSPIYDPYAGDITKTGSVNIAITGTYINSNGTLTNYNGSCGSVPVSAVSGSNLSTETTGTCVLSSVPVNGIYQVTIVPSTGSYYVFPGGYDTSVTIGTSNGGGSFITGGGYQSASYLNSDPINSATAPAGYLLGEKPLAAKMNFGFVAKYNKSGSNLQASANIIVRTHCMSQPDITTLGIANYTPKPGNDGLCAYQIKSNKVVSMSDTAFLIACTATSTNCTPGYGALVVGANVQDVTWPTGVSLGGNLQLQLTMFENGQPGSGTNAAPDTLAIQLNDSKGNLWFSNSWSGTKTVIENGPTTSTVGQYAPILNGGNLQVH